MGFQGVDLDCFGDWRQLVSVVTVVTVSTRIKFRSRTRNLFLDEMDCINSQKTTISITATEHELTRPKALFIQQPTGYESRIDRSVVSD